ncbi:unnamed protein product, partial [Symbiodinium necroappetens]
VSKALFIEFFDCCMSDLEGELLSLANAVRELTLEVRKQGRELQALHRLVESRLDFQVISEPDSSRPATPARLTAASSASAVAVSSSKQASRLISDQERRLVAERIGAFFKQSLAGQHRGASGREDNPLGSKLYVLIRDAQGCTYSPPVLVASFAKLKRLVKPQGVVSEEAIFCGFPTQWEAEAEAEESGSEEVHRPADLYFVWSGGATNFEYEVGALTVGEGDNAKQVAVILVTALEGRTLAVFPQGAWAKKVKQRRLPSGPFSKPLLAEVAVSSVKDRRLPEQRSRVKVWFGLLEDSLANLVTFDVPGPVDMGFQLAEQSRLPFAQALVDVAESQFGFMTAASPDQEAGGSAALEARLRALEASLKSVVGSVQQLVDRQPERQRPDAVARSKAPARKKKPEGSIPGTPPPPGRAREVPGLDPAVLQAARDAGVRPDELNELAGFLGSRSRPLGDFPAAGAGAGDLEAPSELGGSGAEGSERGSGAGGQAPIEAAVVTLTGLMKEIVKDRTRQSDRALTLESALDRAESSSWDASGSASSGSRSKSVAYRVLRESLRKRPEVIYQSIENLLEEDLLSRRATGNLAASQASARAWVEFRSRVGNYPSTIRAMWAIAGILDSLRDGSPAEARARACLALASFDQQSIDNGAWVYAQEITLEPSPPLSAFQSRRVVVSEGRAIPLHRRRTTMITAKGADAAEAKAKREAPTGALAQCDKTALRLTALVMDHLLARPLNRLKRGPACSPYCAQRSSQLVSPVSRGWDRVARRVLAWNEYPAVSAEEMGRAATKVEKIEEQVASLRYATPDAHTCLPDIALARDVDASRVTFPEAPAFDPCPFLDDTLRDLYVFPSRSSCGFADLPDPPRVRFRARDKKARIELLTLLDSTDRLALHPAEPSDMLGCAGLFAIPKSMERDRLIIDARPGNMTQATDTAWLITMATASSLLGLELLPEEDLWISGADVKDYYHNFLISADRSHLYRFVGTYTPAELSHLRAFRPELLKCKAISASLCTMAMGDVNSVTFGQAAHVGLMLAAGVIPLSSLLTLRGRIPRAPTTMGVVIDDLILLEKSLRSVGPLHSADIMAAAHQAYKDAHLPIHAGKCFQEATAATFWGCDVDGSAGWVRPSWARLVPLVGLSLACLRLPCLSVSLLETLAGSWISVLSFRRRCLSMLDHIYVLQRGKSRKELVSNIPELRAELFCLCVLAPQLASDLRAQSSNYLVATDSADDRGAAVGSSLEGSWGRELQRHTLTKGLWNRLLKPSDVMLRRAGQLPWDQ